MYVVVGFFKSGRESKNHRRASPQSKLMHLLRVGVHEELEVLTCKTGARPCVLCFIPLSCYLITPFNVPREFILFPFKITRSDMDP